MEWDVFYGNKNLDAVYISDLSAWSKIYFGNQYANPLYYAHHLYLNNQEITDLVIPEGITSLGEYAFTGCSNVISLTLPKSLISIDEDAFSDCTSLTSVTIPNSVTSIGNYAFEDCTGLTSVTNLALKPQSIEKDVFSDVDLGACVLYVPEESLDAYKAADGWKEFGEILPIETSAIEGISANVDAAAEYYNLQGVRVVGEPTPGIYIKHVGTQAEKVLVK